ncbi:MAG: ABC transporter substrate-binding protein [Pyrinomonadaceae bacterium]
MSRSGLLPLGVSILFWLAVCLASPASAAAQDKVILQLNFDHQFEFAGYYAADWEGFYREAGIEVEIRSGISADKSAADVIDELKSGRADFVVAAGDALVARSEGVPIVLLASIFQESAVEVFARPDKKLLSPADIVNLRLQKGFSRDQETELTAMLGAEGVDPKGVSFLPEPASVEEQFDRLISGDVDAAVSCSLFLPWIAREKGAAFTRLRPSAYSVNFYGDSLFTHQRLIDRDPDLVERFVAASLKGWRHALDNPEKVSEQINAKLSRQLPIGDPDAYNAFLAGRIKQLTMYPVVQIGYVNPTRWREMNDALRRVDLVRADLDTEAFIFDPQQDRTRQIMYLVIGLIALTILLIGYIARVQYKRYRERERGLHSLRKSENRLRAIVEAEPECVKVISSDFRLLEMNPAGLKMIEADSLAEAQKAPLIEFLLPEYREEFGRLHRRLLKGEEFQYEYEIKGLRGTHRWMETHATPLRGEHGEVMLLAITRDITEKKEAEKTMRDQGEQILQMQKMEAVGRLAGGIAHDFNNLLTAINGYSDLALMRLSGDDPLLRHLQEIKGAGDRAANLTRQLLAFSRKQIMQPKVLNLNQLISEINKLLLRLIGEDIEITTKLPPDLGWVSADPGQLEQVVVNLAVNARDAMPEGGRLTIETANVVLDKDYAQRHFPVKPGRYVMLAVSDTGTGIEKAEQERIFEPFYTTKEIGRGTGLGLATVHGIVRQSGGDIWVYSELGRGTTFKIYLPRVEAESDKFQTEVVLPSVSSGNETILLVEDDEVVRGVIISILELGGYQVFVASNGEDALRMADADFGPIQLLLTDVVMPRMSGREVAEQFRKLDPDIRVLYISGYTEDTIVHHGMLDEGIDFLEKPFTPDALLDKVREVLEK